MPRNIVKRVTTTTTEFLAPGDDELEIEDDLDDGDIEEDEGDEADDGARRPRRTSKR